MRYCLLLARMARILRPVTWLSGKSLRTPIRVPCDPFPLNHLMSAHPAVRRVYTSPKEMLCPLSAL